MTDQSHRQQSIDRAGYVSTLIQGEVVELADACVILADPRFPLSEQSEDLDDQDFAMVAVPWRVERVVLITQTCDLQITDHQNFLCQVAPVIEVGKTISNEALRGRRPGSAALPWFSETAVADLSKITSLERSLLVEKGLSGHPRSALESLHFAEAISRHFTRTALPNPINEALRQFLER